MNKSLELRYRIQENLYILDESVLKGDIKKALGQLKISIKNEFKNNKRLVISDILRGKGGLSAEWFLVTRKNNDNSIDWKLKDINNVCNFYSQGEVEISPRGSLKIGRVTMQRKGGTPDPTSLQFKINPLALFED